MTGVQTCALPICFPVTINAARRKLEKEGKVHKFDGKDVDHKKALSHGGTNAISNLRVVSASKNRSFARRADGSMKRNGK